MLMIISGKLFFKTIPSCENNYQSIFKDKILSKETAKYLFSGIVGDSGRFQFPSTTADTFKAAAKLLKTGIDMQKDVYQPMYIKSIKDLEVSKYLLNNYCLSEHQTVAYYFMDDEHQKLFDINVDRGKENLSFFSGFEEIKIWVSFTEDVENNNWRVSIRSREIIINEVAEKYRGGGHNNASGARVLNKEEALELIKDLDNVKLSEKHDDYKLASIFECENILNISDETLFAIKTANTTSKFNILGGRNNEC